MVAAMARMDRGDIAPMIHTTYPDDGPTIRRVIPWQEAVNLDPERAAAAPLTTAERVDLRIIAARARADGGDMAPLVFTSTRKVAPWRTAINMEVNR